MFKALLLQSWYALSDPALEKQLARDLLFRRFIGLSISESAPDHSTLWRFRQLLEKKALINPLLNVINDQLTEQGLYIKAGEISVIDANVIEAKQCRPNKNKIVVLLKILRRLRTSKQVLTEGVKVPSNAFLLYSNNNMR